MPGMVQVIPKHILWPLAAALALSAGLVPEAKADDAALTFFESRVRPVLAEHCLPCHGPAKQKGGLRLDHGSFLMKGGDNGPALVPGDPEASQMLQAVGFADVDLQMPPDGKLPDALLDDLRTWIAAGAIWPDEPLPLVGAKAVFDLAGRRASHWAWQPLSTTEAPALASPWPRNDVDRFVLARLEAEGLAPAPRADKSTLLRRLTFDLTGLPPSPEAAKAFVEDPAPDAYDRAVDRLLATPQFGEHWARMWLDLTRYAETYGFEQDFNIREAWRYRDYVIRAFNADLPYDQFVREHLAGDLLSSPRLNPEDGSNESILATGGWLMYQTQHAPVDVRMDYADRVDNEIDVFGKTFLGMTVACARCHDHKFDAISTADYYALAGVFRSARQAYVERDPGDEVAAAVQALAPLSARGKALLPAMDASPTPVSLPPDAVLFEDFSDGYAGWFASGAAFGDAPTGASAWMPLNKRTRLRLPTGVAHSGTLGTKLRGVLRSPTFRLSHDRIQFLAAGKDAQIRLVIEGYQLRDLVPLLFESTLLDVKHGNQFRWLEMGGLGKYQGCEAYLEFIDPGEGYLGVDQILFSDAGPPPAPAEYAAPEINPDGFKAILREMDAVQGTIPDPEWALTLADGNGLDEPIFVRGNPRNHGETVPRRFLEALAGPDQPSLGAGSGRLALADRLLDPANPLPARVMVNRIWQHLFGRGLVATVDNFGAMGQPPSHPELLDYLAAQFRADGWSIKHMIRTLVTSETYRMSSVPNDPHAEEVDPANILLHRMPLRRLHAEPIRDALLAVAGTLDPQSGGPSVPAYISPFMGGLRKPATSGPMDGARRRSIYVELRRNFLPAFLQAFDFPTPDTTHGQRNVSNVPAQSLVLMNDPFVAEQAAAWAARRCEEDAASPEARIEALYWDAFARAPRAEETATALQFLRDQAAPYQGSEAEALRDPRAWSELCHALYTLKEFVFIG